ncbi:hypothetical protein bcgnr5411_54000 [Bacillus cereus]|uniref:Uncharacterized protein n=2 Tax=Bacillus TaxID=1386 RepID=A0AB36V8C4_BACTU|nr:hypothetical protein IGE_05643 [Bacillus cereus HuB1-1]PGZ02220.1 hypothetical protein COE48_18180 [Bacillus thuringiensis]
MMKKEKVIDIRNGYGMEVDNIRTKLSELENGRIYELTGARMDGSIAQNIQRLKDMLNDLCNKIEYGKDSMIEEIATLHETKDSK